MNIKFGVVLLATLASVVGCSSAKNSKIASGDFSYTKAEPAASIKVPVDLDQPEFTQEFAIPKMGDKAPVNLVGKKLQIVAPSLVLPLVSGSYIEDGSKVAKIKFDKIDDSKPLDESIWETVRSFLDDKDIEVESFDPDKGILLTDWLRIEEDIESKWYSPFSKKSEIGEKFKFDLTLAPHGRTAELRVELKDYIKTVEGNAIVTEPDVIARTEEVAMLNEFIIHYEYSLGVKVTKLREKIKQGLDTQMGFDDDGAPAFVVDGIYDITWPRLQLVLRNLGFDVKDLDKSNGLVFVSYAGPGGSWWSNIFSTKKKLLEIDDYRLKIVPRGEKTVVTFMTEQSEPFKADQLADLFEPFSETMSKNNLDI